MPRDWVVVPGAARSELAFDVNRPTSARRDMVGSQVPPAVIAVG